MIDEFDEQFPVRIVDRSAEYPILEIAEEKTIRSDTKDQVG